MPMYNEEKYIVDTLMSLFHNTYSKDKFEIIVVNGKSIDNCAAKVLELMDTICNLRLLESSTNNTPTNVNLGIDNAKGEFVLFLSAHTIYQPEFLETLMNSYQKHQCSVLGGVIDYYYTNIIGQAIKIAWSSKIGSGDSAYKVTKNLTEADSAFCCVFPKQIWIDVGKFDERLSCNQDYEFNIRVRKLGHKILIDPSISVKYNVKNNFISHAKQYWRYGWYRLYTLAKWPSSVRPRQILPSILVLTLISTLLLGFVGIVGKSWFSASLIIPLGYFSLCFLNGFRAAFKESNYQPLLGFYVGIAIILMHLCYGTGMIFSFFSFKWRKMLQN